MTLTASVLKMRKPTKKPLGTITLCAKVGNQFVPIQKASRGTWWEIDCEPHVMTRLKRTFGRSDARSFGKLRLRNTDEVCRDLAWFIQRFPLEVQESDYLNSQASQHEQRIVDFENILSGQVDSRTFDLAIPARQYQQIATLIIAGNILVVYLPLKPDTLLKP